MKQMIRVLNHPVKYAVLLICLSGSAYAQLSEIVSGVTTGSAVEGEELSVRIEFFQSNVNTADLFYRSSGESEFKQIEMFFAGLYATANIPGYNVTGQLLEYYFVMQLNDGTTAEYPVGAPDAANTLQIQITPKSPRDKELLVLAPESGEKVYSDALFVSVSLLELPDNVDGKATKIFLNNQDVSQYAQFTDELILLYGEDLPELPDLGRTSLRVEAYDKSGNLYHSKSLTFDFFPADYKKVAGTELEYRLNVKGESRNEEVKEFSQWFNILDLDSDAKYGDWRLDAELYLTSEERYYLQPKHRFKVGLKNDFVEVSFGDNLPRYPSLLLNGKRVRGFNGGLFFGFFNVEASFGQIRRGINGDIQNIFPANYDTLGTNIVSLNDSVRAAVSYGEFERDIFMLRPSFGSGENFQFGLSYLHSGDDMNSINYGPSPKENVVFGTDLMFGFDNRNILFTSQAAFSVSNSDISTGSLDDDLIDSVFAPGGSFAADPTTVKNLKNTIDQFITFNQYITPLNPQELATFAMESALTLNYFDNMLRAKYLYRGNDYQSFGNSYLENDLAGINIYDRVRLLQNKIYLSFTYENLQDNLQKTKVATTTYQTISSSATFMAGIDIPTVTLGYTRYDNSNGLDPSDSLLGYFYIEDVTNRYTATMSYRFFLGYTHNATFAFILSDREDLSVDDRDALNTSILLTSSTTWNRDLSSSLNFQYNQSKIAGTDYNYFTISTNAKYYMMERKMLLSGGISPSFGDFSRTAFDILGRYYLLNNLSLQFQLRYLMYNDRSDDTVIGVSTRFDLR